MSPEMEALARRAVATKHWRWLPGMLVHSTWYSESFRLDCDIADHEAEGRLTNEAIPDLTDPATLGCLLHLWREVQLYREDAEAIGVFLVLRGLTDPYTVDVIVTALEAAR